MQIAAQFLPRIRRDEPMSRHTSWHAGGPADIYFTPQDRADLRAFLHSVPEDMPVSFVGLGSNLLVRDGGIRGVVVATQDALLQLTRVDETTIYGEAGVPCARIARQCIQWQLAGAEFFAGIPGTLGGALAMNAGAWGGETWNCVVSVETVDRHGQQYTRAPGDYSVSYRQVLPHHPGEWSCGSVFRNPPGDHAARLIEAAGLKGLRIGDAAVSLKHANFIINHGAATATDLEQLVLQVQQRVRQVHGIALQPEVRIVGEQL